jgi:signal transduction histidine kinase
VAVHRDPAKQEVLENLAQRYQGYVQHPESLLAQALRTGEPVLISEFAEQTQAYAEAEVFDRCVELQPKSGMIVPLAAYEQTLGIIQVAITESERRYGSADLTLAVEMARRAAIAVDNAQLYRQAQALSRLKDEFLATLSHELRTPLHAVMGWAQLLQNREFDDITSRAVETIARNARLQAQIIDDLLDASRLVTGRLRLRPYWVDLVAIVNGTIDAMLLAAEAKSLHLNLRLEMVGSLWLDPRYIRQVVWNLLSNAIKFTPPGGWIEVHLTRDGNDVQLQVTDSGVGISPEFLPYVFDRFRQEDGSLTRTYGGLGLGLALVRYLVELHGGTIAAASEGEGKGATFTVRLPLTNLPPQ